MPKVVNPRAVRRKIRAVQNLKKITKAMEMVSAAKLKKVQGRLLAIRPYSDKLRELLGDLSARAGEIKIPMLEPRPRVRRVSYVVFAADKGLCGSYNSNVLRLAARATAEAAAGGREAPMIFTIGRKSGDFFRKRGLAPAEHWQGLPADVGFKQVREITGKVIGAYRREEVDEVFLVYSEFVNAVTFRPRAVKFLPFETEGEAARAVEIARQREKKGRLAGPEGPQETISRRDEAGGAEKKVEPAQGYIFEPGPEVILGQLIPRYVEVLFYRILLESLASEHAARMSAMRNATDNAQELIESLTLQYNKARQAAITKELLDIVGGAEALKG
jgi:F-type H+-transporting ATPase subunit gamma